jgi:hypothetical protein
LVNLNMQKLEGSFWTYVRPDCHPQLSQFFKLLTGLQQAEVCVQWVPFNLRPYCNHFCALFFHWFLLNVSCVITGTNVMHYGMFPVLWGLRDCFTEICATSWFCARIMDCEDLYEKYNAHLWGHYSEECAVTWVQMPHLWSGKEPPDNHHWLSSYVSVWLSQECVRLGVSFQFFGPWSSGLLELSPAIQGAEFQPRHNLRTKYIAYGHNTSFLLQLFHSRLSSWVMFIKEFCSIVQKTLSNICSLLYRAANIYTLQWVFLGLGMQTGCSRIQTHVFHSVKMVQSLLLSHFETIYVLE